MGGQPQHPDGERGVDRRFLPTLGEFVGVRDYRFEDSSTRLSATPCRGSRRGPRRKLLNLRSTL